MRPASKFLEYSLAAISSFIIVILFVVGFYYFNPPTVPERDSQVTIGKLKEKGKVLFGYGSEWTQNSWTGGTDSGSTYVVAWGSAGGWNKYSSATNVTIDAGGVTDDGSGLGVLTSSILDLGSKRRLGSVTHTNTGLDVKGGDDTAELQNDSWEDADNYPNTATNKRYVQYRIRDINYLQTVTSIKLTSETTGITGSVTNASTNLPISGATVTKNGESTTTAFQPSSKNLFIKSAVAAGGGSGFYSFSFEYDASVTSYTLTASKAGYKSQTKTVTVDPVNGGDAYFSLTPVSSSEGSSSSSESATSNVVPTTTTTSITKVTLPSIFTKKGSKTTDLSKISDPKKVENLTLDVVGKSKIVFKDTIDLSANKTIAAFEKLNKYLVVGTGYVDLNSKILSALNKKATIIMYKLKHTFTPEILINGKKDIKHIISSIDYSEKNGVLDFDVAHFSKLEAAVKFIILYPTSTSVSEPNTEIKAKISDPTAVVTGSFNGVKLANITPDKETGEFTLKDLTFNKGVNVLKLNAESKIGKVAPLASKFTYGEAETTTEKATRTLTLTILLIGTLVALMVAIIVVYFIYKNKKSLYKLTSGQKEQPPTQEENS
jgi:hypothetical protein